MCYSLNVTSHDCVYLAFHQWVEERIKCVLLCELSSGDGTADDGMLATIRSGSDLVFFHI